MRLFGQFLCSGYDNKSRYYKGTTCDNEVYVPWGARFIFLSFIQRWESWDNLLILDPQRRMYKRRG